MTQPNRIRSLALVGPLDAHRRVTQTAGFPIDPSKILPPPDVILLVADADDSAMIAPRGRRSTAVITPAPAATTSPKTPVVRSMPFSENGGLSDHVRNAPTTTSPKPRRISQRSPMSAVCPPRPFRPSRRRRAGVMFSKCPGHLLQRMIQ